MWIWFKFSEDVLESLLTILTKAGEDPSLDAGYDIGINIYSKTFNLLAHFPGSESELRGGLPDEALDENGKNEVGSVKLVVPSIVVFAQWCNLGTEPFSPTIFNALKAVSPFKFVKNSPDGASMSQIMSMWLFKQPREFLLPYNKRTRSTNSVQLSSNSWITQFTQHVKNLLQTPNLFISSQLQIMGGPNSMLLKNAGNGTAYTWRDATVVATWDAFYSNQDDDAAETWQRGSDQLANQYFDRADRRLLWGSYGEWDMMQVWQHYYDPATYQRLQQIKRDNDPKGLFTANPFAVQAASSQ